MTFKELKKLKDSFDKLDSIEQWDWFIANKGKLTGYCLILDNDQTWVQFKGDVEDEDTITLDFNAWLGNSYGVGHLLTALRINWEDC